MPGLPFRSFALIVWLTLLPGLSAQAAGPAPSSAVPRARLPPTVQSALGTFENQFELTLAQDCPSEKCFSRGCTYVSHETVDRARAVSLPGLGEPETAPGAAGQAQEYLTAARCEFAYENTLPAKDIATLVKRLEQKLSRGYTTLTVEARPLPALPAALRATPAPLATPFSQPTPASPSSEATPDANPLGQGAQAEPSEVRELWKSLLPHFSWMIAILLGTTAVLVVIWAMRRLGRPSAIERAEEQAFLATLEDTAPGGDGKETDEPQGGAPGSASSPTGASLGEGGVSSAPAISSDAILKSYGTPAVWKSRMTSEPAVFEGVVKRWLREKDYAAIAKLALGSQEEFRKVLPSGEEFALERAELADTMSHIAVGALPTDDEFAVLLSNAIVTSYVSEHGDDELVNLARLLREQFGPEGFAQIIGAASDRLGAVLFAVIPAWRQIETAQLLPVGKRIALVGSLAAMPRASRSEITGLLRVVNAAVRGETIAPEDATGGTATGGGVSHGRDLQSGQALSALLPVLPREARRAFVKAEKERFHGATPPWTDGLFYPAMLAALPQDARSGLFLQFDARDIALWMLAIAPELRQRLIADLPSSLGAAVQSYLVGGGGLKGTATEGRAVREKVRRALAEAVRAEVLGGRLQLEDAV